MREERAGCVPELLDVRRGGGALYAWEDMAMCMSGGDEGSVGVCRGDFRCLLSNTCTHCSHLSGLGSWDMGEGQRYIGSQEMWTY